MFFHHLHAIGHSNMRSIKILFSMCGYVNAFDQNDKVTDNDKYKDRDKHTCSRVFQHAMSKISFSVCGDFMHPPFYYPFFQYVDRLFLTFNANFERDSYLGPLFIVCTEYALSIQVAILFHQGFSIIYMQRSV